jgi:hypothetical protein
LRDRSLLLRRRERVKSSDPRGQDFEVALQAMRHQPTQAEAGIVASRQAAGRRNRSGSSRPAAPTPNSQSFRAWRCEIRPGVRAVQRFWRSKS